MPFQQLLRRPFPLIRRYPEILRLRSVRKQCPLPLADTNRHVPQWASVLRPHFVLWPVIQYVGAFALGFTVASIGLPHAFRQSQNMFLESARHARADGECDCSLGPSARFSLRSHVTRFWSQHAESPRNRYSFTVLGSAWNARLAIGSSSLCAGTLPSRNSSATTRSISAHSAS